MSETVEREKYNVKEGVAWVNREKVAKRKTLMLTPSEAAFDLAQGRIVKHKSDADSSNSKKISADVDQKS